MPSDEELADQIDVVPPRQITDMRDRLYRDTAVDEGRRHLAKLEFPQDQGCRAEPPERRVIVLGWVGEEGDVLRERLLEGRGEALRGKHIAIPLDLGEGQLVLWPPGNFLDRRVPTTDGSADKGSWLTS